MRSAGVERVRQFRRTKPKDNRMNMQVIYQEVAHKFAPEPIQNELRSLEAIHADLRGLQRETRARERDFMKRLHQVRVTGEAIAVH